MSLRWATLPLGLRQSIFSQLETTTWKQAKPYRSSSWTYRCHHRVTYSTQIPYQNLKTGRNLNYLWLIPLTGGAALLLAPRPQSPIPVILSSPTVIPCNESNSQSLEPLILSPAEPDQSILSRILSLLHDKIWEPILTTQRFIHLLFLFLPVLVTAPMLLIGVPEDKLGGDRWGAVWWYGYLTSQMQQAGPTFVKLAQWAASRADLFPSLLCERLGSLHSRAKPHSLKHTKRIIERVFQRPFEEVFEEFDETPIGAGAIAQVYRATLKSDLVPPSHLIPKRQTRTPAAVLTPAALQQPPLVPTSAVAIKVLHPRVEKTIMRDLKIMTFFANTLNLIPGVQWFSLPEEVEVFGRMMNEQLDLRVEGRNLAEFENKFSGRRLPVTFPRPLQIWSTKDVLVEEFQHALSMELFLKNGGGPYDDILAEVGLDAFLNMLLLDNFVHSDLHPGNIMVKFAKPETTRILLKNAWDALWRSKSEVNPPVHDIDSESIITHLHSLRNHGNEWRAALHEVHEQGYLPEIIFIDAGLVTTLSAKNRANFLELFRAIAEFDGYRAGQLMVARCRTPELTIDPETFALKMQHVVLNVKRKTFSLGQIKISDILNQVLKAVREHHVKMEADFVNTVISVLLLEGIGRQLDPGLDLFKSALPVLRQLGRQVGTQETVKQMPKGDIGAFLKVWVWMEARELASAAMVDADELVRYDWLVPSI